MVNHISTKSSELQPWHTKWDAIAREYQNDVTRVLRMFRNRAEADEQVENIRANNIRHFSDFREHRQLPKRKSNPMVEAKVEERLEESDRACSRLMKFNAYREKWSEKGEWQIVRCPKNAEYTPGCVVRVKAFCTCGGLYYDGTRSKNCAHMLCDILIKSGKLTPWPDNCVCCPAGRPIIASQVGDYIFTDQMADPDPDEHYYIFCIGPGSKGQGYYGTRDRRIHGTGSSGRYGSTLAAIEYYTGIEDASKWAFEKLHAFE